MLRRLLLPLLAPALLLGFLASPAHAKVIRLRTGESVKCVPLLERSDDRFLVVEDLLSGAVRAFAWEALEPSDRDDVKRDFGWESNASFTVKGLRVVHRLEGGDEEELFGFPEKEEGGKLYLRRNGQVLEIPASKIVERTEELMDPREIWTPAQLMERLAAEWTAKGQDIATTEGLPAFNVAEYAEWAGALKEALEAYRRAAADPEFTQRQVAEQRAVRVEALLRDQAALATLRDLKTKLGSNLFRAVRTGLDGFDAKHPGASEGVTKALETFKVATATARERFFRRKAQWDFVKICEKLAEAKVKERDVKLADIRSWLRRDLPDAAFTALGESMARIDDVTPEEVRAFWEKRWEGRQKSGWTRKTYGAGTFVVHQPVIKPPKPRTGGAPQGRGGQGGGGAAPAIQIPKPPTPDQWWAIASPSEKVQWVMALFATTSGLFEVSEDLERRPCGLCQGQGLIRKALQTGDTLEYLCTRCAGARYDVTVKFR